MMAEMNMCSTRRKRAMVCIALLGALFAASVASAQAQPATSVDDLAAAVVRIKAFINPDGRTVANLGVEREG